MQTIPSLCSSYPKPIITVISSQYRGRPNLRNTCDLTLCYFEIRSKRRMHQQLSKQRSLFHFSAKYILELCVSINWCTKKNMSVYSILSTVSGPDITYSHTSSAFAIFLFWNVTFFCCTISPYGLSFSSQFLTTSTLERMLFTEK